MTLPGPHPRPTPNCSYVPGGKSMPIDLEGKVKLDEPRYRYERDMMKTLRIHPM